MNTSANIEFLHFYNRGIRSRELVTKDNCVIHCWLFYVYSGKIHYKDDKNDMELLPFHMYILPMRKPYSITPIPDVDFDHFYAAFVTQHWIKDLIDIDTTQDKYAADMIKLINKYLKKNESIIMRTLIESIVKYAVETSEKLDQSLAARLHAYINKNYKNNLTLKDLSAEFNYSSKYLEVKFNEKFNISLMQYCRSLRYECILNMLSKNASLAEICEELNYSSISNLSRDFKKEFYISPKKFKVLYSQNKTF